MCLAVQIFAITRVCSSYQYAHCKKPASELPEPRKSWCRGDGGGNYKSADALVLLLMSQHSCVWCYLEWLHVLTSQEHQQQSMAKLQSVAC